MNAVSVLKFLRKNFSDKSIANFTVWDSVFKKITIYPNGRNFDVFPVCIRQSRFSHMILFAVMDRQLLVYDPCQDELDFFEKHEKLVIFFENFTSFKIKWVKFIKQDQNKYDCVDLCLKFMLSLNKNGIR